MGSLEDHNPHHFNPLDLEEFRTQAYQTIDFIVNYYQNIETFPVLSQAQPGFLKSSFPNTPPNKPQPFETTLQDVQTKLMPGITHWLSPNFFAYFPSTISTAGFLGEMLCTAFNTVGFNWLASPASTELEILVMDWMAKMLRLPKTFMFCGSGGGVLHGTTSEAMLCTLVAARDRALAVDPNRDVNKLVVYGSDQTHSTYAKACKIAGIPPENIRTICTTLGSEFGLEPRLVFEAMEADVAGGLKPIYLCATVGTTSSTAVDPVDGLADVAKRFGVWFHVDAAYAGSACICPEFRGYLDGVELADSLSLSPHKWFLSCLDCCCLWVKEPGLVTASLSTDPEYLKNKQSESNSVVDFKDWQVGTGRRFRAIRLWMIFQMYGVANLQSHIRSDIHLAKGFEKMVKSDSRFEIVVPRRFALVCFRLNPPRPKSKPKVVELLNRKLLEWVNSTGRLYMTHSIVGGIYFLRFAVGATLTEDRHVAAAWEVISEGADQVLRDQS
ncbi:hypothetical protein Scep_028596 [Stephania cephalantha]|uniref:tyrosine decarboxylase n=1 Tax=Stephania cephalantha TaxID=152367 RepID=A0AAP0EIM1_9MAGN